MSTDEKMRQGKMVPRMLNWRLDLIKTARSVTVTTTSKITGPMIGAVTAKTAEPDPNSDVKSSFSAKNVKLIL